MVGIVLVSHSRTLAHAVRKLVRSMTGEALPIAVAAGVGENHQELGTDAVEIAEAIVSVKSPDGVLVLMDMGSAILSSETALDLIDPEVKALVHFCAAPFVEGAVAAGVTANLGASLEEVRTEALAALRQKQAALGVNHAADQAAAPANGHRNGAGVAEKIRVTIRNQHGLHARPAAKLIAETRPFQSEITVRNLTNQRGPVSIKSLSSLASLEILQGNEIEIAANGDDAHKALEKIALLIDSGLGDAPPVVVPVARMAAETARLPSPAAGPIPICGGIAIGPGLYLQAAVLDIPTVPAGDVAHEIDRLRKAVDLTQKAIECRGEKLRGAVGDENAGIYEAQVLALQDPELTDSAVRLIRDSKLNAAQAWDIVNREVVARYESLQDEYLRERAGDLEDVGRQVLELLVDSKPAASALTEPGVVIADNFTPYQVSTLNAKLVRGVVLLDGGPTAHSSILLRALGIPTVAQARRFFANTDFKRPLRVALDGSTGQLWLNPGVTVTAELEGRQAEERKRADEERKASALPATTSDGRHVEIFANIGDVSEVEVALRQGAEGVGLLRTEFLFLNRASAPTEDEQLQALKAVAEKMGSRPLIVRTLDAGGDKALPYLAMPAEENPFLGVRAIRLSLSHEVLFNTQLRAILRAGHGRDLRVMFPMIANTSDLDRCFQALEKTHLELLRENVPHLWPVKTGIMIEIPSAAILADSMASKADFFSIGTNDLTQYALAADRGNPELGSYQDALHPAVLRLIEMVVHAAQKYDRLVAVCGEAASDERAAAIFVGLGVTELSMTSSKIPHLKACLRRQSFASLQKLAYSALHCHTAAEVRALKPGG